MKRSILTLIALTLIIFIGCSKSEDAKPEQPSLVNTKWESFYFTGSMGQEYMKRLVFTSNTQVEYFITWQSPTTPTSVGRSVLSYTFDGTNVHVTGTLNGFNGEAGKGDKVDYTLKYSPNTGGNAKSALRSADDYYMPY